MTNAVFKTWNSVILYNYRNGRERFHIHVEYEECYLHLTYSIDQGIGDASGIRRGSERDCVNLIHRDLSPVLRLIQKRGSFSEETYGFDCKFKDTLSEMAFLELFKTLWDERLEK